MSSTQIANGTVRLNASAGYIRRLFTSCSSAFQEWRDRQKLRTALHDLSDFSSQRYRHRARRNRLCHLEPVDRPTRARRQIGLCPWRGGCPSNPQVSSAIK